MSTLFGHEIPIRVSAKTLGGLALPSCCERCFWLQARVGSSVCFPGIFSKLDSWQKHLTLACLREVNAPPAYLQQVGQFCVPIPCPHHTRFYIDDPASGVRLTGAPDQLFRQPSGEVVVADYKTAAIPTRPDPFAPVYLTQVNAYAHIVEQIGMGRVSHLLLVYFEPRVEPSREQISTSLRHHRAELIFGTKTVEVPLCHSEIIPPLLERAGAIVRRREPPPARAGCRDCVRMGQVTELLSLEKIGAGR